MKQDIRNSYKNNTQFLLSFALMLIPIGYLLFSAGWIAKSLAALVMLSAYLIIKSISKHYCSLLEKKNSEPEH